MSKSPYEYLMCFNCGGPMYTIHFEASTIRKGCRAYTFYCKCPRCDTAMVVTKYQYKHIYKIKYPIVQVHYDHETGCCTRKEFYKSKPHSKLFNPTDEVVKPDRNA